MTILLICLVALCCNLTSASDLSTNEIEAWQWLSETNEEYQLNYTANVEASWAYSTNINDENALKQLKAKLSFNAFQLEKRLEMDAKFDWKNFNDSKLQRIFNKLSDVGISIVKDDAKQAEFNSLIANMTRVQSEARVKNPISGQMINLNGVLEIMANQNVEEQVKKELWKSLRDASGKPVRSDYERYVELFNQMIHEAGYSNVANYWQSWYEPKEDENFEQTMEKLWEEVKPMYAELHAYMRHKLIKLYGSEIFPPTGQIPGHILGHMWGGRWDDLEQMTKPFPDEETKIDITSEMLSQNWTVRKIFETSEEFFASLGLGNMTELFWKNSVIVENPNVSMVCHASAWDFYTGKGDFRIKQCTQVNQYYLAVTHHEMGHIQYYQQYEKQPIVFRGGANPGFHEAVGDVIELSVMTPGHLKKIKLLDSVSNSNEFDINYLYLMALKKVAYLPFAYLVDQWRWKVFKGDVPKEEYNNLWVKQRCQLMGVSSPVWRESNDFDPGAIYHIVANVPYIRYFISYVLQFQLHKALCNAAGITENIHKCSIYKNEAAGAKLKALLEKGSSVHWQEVLYELTGNRRITAQPMIEYFQPLIQHIKTVNSANNVKAGWDEKCPDASWYNKESTRSFASGLTVFIAGFVAVVCFQM